MAFEDGDDKVVEALYALRDMVKGLKREVDQVQNFLEEGSSSIWNSQYNNAEQKLDKILSEMNVEEK